MLGLFRILSERNFWIAISVLLVASYVVFWEGCYGSAFLTSDSCQYLRCAEKIRALGALDGLEGFEGDSWFCVWPLGYPAAIAAFSWMTGLDGFMATRALAMCSVAVLLVAIWRMARSAFPILAFGLLNLALLKTVRSPLSEVLFMPLLAILGLYLYRGHCRVVCLVVLFVSLFAVRYVGVFAPVWVGVGTMFLRLRGALDKQDCATMSRKICIASFIAWVLEGLYLLWNLRMTGYPTGMPRDTLQATWPVLCRDVVSAEMHELQAFGIVAVVGACLLMLGMRTMGRNNPGSLRLNRQTGGRYELLLAMGVAYHCTMIVVRCLGGCSELGFRFLYPGTLLIVMGLALAFGDWRDVLQRIRLRPFVVLILCVSVIGCGQLKMELMLRHFIGMRIYGIGDSFPVLKERVLNKYSDVQRGELINLRNLADPDLPVMFLRPDCKVALPKGVQKY